VSLTPADVAADLQLSVPTVLARFKDGTLPGFRIGGHERIREDGRREWVGGRWRIDADALAAWKAGPARPADPTRIEPRSPRSTAAQSRRKSA